jgi:hypothetical protein
VGEKGEGRGKRGIMTQSLYAHMNKGNKKRNGIFFSGQSILKNYICTIPVSFQYDGLLVLSLGYS